MKSISKRSNASRVLLSLLAACWISVPLLAKSPEADSTCKATLNNGILVLENSQLSYQYYWNSGNLSGKSITNRATGYQLSLSGDTPDLYLPGLGKPVNAVFTTKQVEATAVTPAHLEAEVITSFSKMAVKRVFRIYPRCAAIACDLYLKGRADSSWKTTVDILSNLSNIENKAAMAEGKAQTPTLTRLGIPGKHWKVQAIQFFDVTDRNNNLVQETTQLLYRGESRLAGNLLFAHELHRDNGIFILKESPSTSSQIAWPGFDFNVRLGEIQLTGIGIAAQELKPAEWTRCYGFVTGVTSGGRLGAISTLRSYQQQVRIHQPQRDDMILMNTWGDRNQDKSIGEKFTLAELKAAHKLGITHFQLDDGWQTGRSANSAFAGGSFTNIWNNPKYWTPDPAKFPNGLQPVMQLAKELGIEICLWFNPSKDSSFANWRKDAGALISLYKNYGIRTFKIDGVQVPDKQAETNLRKMFDTLMSVTNHQAVFNLDVTAGRRYGYHYFNEYGNIFLENRYTDWGNYYPHWTLRNLWMLSAYVPPQNLQIEFLNNFRNAGKYPSDDSLAPSSMQFEYLFALTMMAQPLAWMEATGLPEKGLAIGPVVKKYRELQPDIHAGKIFPVGEEPDGASWTGFQSIKGNTGYLLVIREKNDRATVSLPTWLPEGKKIKLELLLGNGQSQNTVTAAGGAISFTLPASNSYALYRYALAD